jgi:hypothetical protein
MCGASHGSGCVKFITCIVYGEGEVVGKYQTTFRLGLNRPDYIRGEGIGGGGAKHAAAPRRFCLVFSLYVN